MPLPSRTFACAVMPLLVSLASVACAVMLDNGNSYVYVGESVQLNCSANSAVDSNSDQFYFTLENESGSHRLQGAEVIGGQLTVNVMGEGDGGRYVCWRDTDQGPVMVSGHHVLVQYRPQKVVGLQCEAENWDERLRCWWLYGVHYVNNSTPSPDMSVVAMLRLQSQGVVECTQPLSAYGNGSQCVWSDDQFRAATKYIVVVRVNNLVKVKNNTSMSYIQIISASIVRPSPVSSVWKTAVNTSCVSLAWNHTRVYRSMIFRVNVSNGSSQLVLGRWGTEVCGLLPYTNYSMTVQCRPLASDGSQTGFWSQPTGIQVTTAQAGDNNTDTVNRLP